MSRRARTLAGLLEDGISIRAAAMPGADDLMMQAYAARAKKERELISERTGRRWRRLGRGQCWVGQTVEAAVAALCCGCGDGPD